MKENQVNFLSADEVAARYGIGVSTTWAWAKDGKLPTPFKFGERCTRWKSSELDKFDLQNKVEVAQ